MQPTPPPYAHLLRHGLRHRSRHGLQHGHRSQIALALCLLCASVLIPVSEASSDAPVVYPHTNPGSWHPPFGHPLVVSGPYLAPETPYTAGHRGIDVPAAPGSTVLASADGTVTLAGLVVDRHTITVRVDEDTVYSWEPVESELRAGDRVTAGSPLGVVGTGGHCAEGCVHLGVRVRDEYVSPLRYFLGKPTLLPW